MHTGQRIFGYSTFVVCQLRAFGALKLSSTASHSSVISLRVVSLLNTENEHAKE